MDTILYYICIPLGYLMKGCFYIVSNYGLAIILFTLATKIVLLPVSIWIQKNSILMVKIQPEVNFIKANLKGNIDAIADEQSKLFKREKYHPMLSIVPLVIQLVLLLGVVYIINHPLNYLFGASDSVVNALAGFINADVESSSVQLEIIEAIKQGTITSSSVIEGIDSVQLASIIKNVSNFQLEFLGFNLSTVPASVWGIYVLVPIFAGLSSLIMSITQNLSNVLQHEQSKLNQYGIMALSVGLSLYLGLGVPAGIALYWIASNLLSIVVMYALNFAINPKKYVDYEALEQSRIALAESKAFGAVDKKDPLYKQMRAKEKADYKKFKNIANKHIVIYSEKSGFYKYYKELIEEILKRSNVPIHYVTNDYNDVIFKVAETEPKIKPYYISLKKTPVLMMLVETDLFIMTTPDLNKYYLKRSFIKKDTEYIYVPHDTLSTHMGFQENAFEAFDTVFCAGEHIAKELRETEKVYNSKPKELFEFGFPLLDSLVSKVKKEVKYVENKKCKEILIAPSWQEENILESCLDELITNLSSKNYHLTVRPHPEFVKRYSYKMNQIVDKYKDYDKEKLTFELDFSSNESIYKSDLLITDWSGIAAEFCFATSQPSIFINTKMKVLNPNWQKINMTPVEIDMRDKLGVSVNLDDVKNINSYIDKLFKERKQYKLAIEKYFENYTFNHGCAAEKGAKYVLKQLIERKKNKNSSQNAKQEISEENKTSDSENSSSLNKENSESAKKVSVKEEVATSQENLKEEKSANNNNVVANKETATKKKTVSKNKN